MNAVFMLLLTVTAANLALALFVLWHKPKAEVNRVFAFTSFAVAGWTFTNALFQITAAVTVAMQAAAFSYLSAVALGASFLHFAWIFPRHTTAPEAMARLAKSLLWGIALAVGLLPFVPGAVIQSVSITGNRAIHTNAGIYAIALFMLVTSCWAFGRLLRQHRQLRDLAHAQSRYVLAGSALTASTGLICNLLLPLLGNYSLVWLGPTSSLFFVGFSVYAIIAQHLFDIRIIIKRTLVYSILLAGIAGGYSTVQYLLTEGLQHAAVGSQHPLLSNVGGAVAVSLCVTPARRWLERWLDDLLFHRHRHHKSRQRHRQAKAEQE